MLVQVILLYKWNVSAHTSTLPNWPLFSLLGCHHGHKFCEKNTIKAIIHNAKVKFVCSLINVVLPLKVTKWHILMNQGGVRRCTVPAPIQCYIWRPWLTSFIRLTIRLCNLATYDQSYVQWSPSWWLVKYRTPFTLHRLMLWLSCRRVQKHEWSVTCWPDGMTDS